MDLATLSACAVRGLNSACSDDCAAFPKPSRSLPRSWRTTDQAGIKLRMPTLFSFLFAPHKTKGILTPPVLENISSKRCKSFHLLVHQIYSSKERGRGLWSTPPLAS